MSKPAPALWGSGELMIIILAALLDVPAEQYEAAELDGAGPVRRFWHVTLPSISPVPLFGVVNSMIYALQFFTQAIMASSASAGTADVAGDSKLIGAPENSTLTYPAEEHVVNVPENGTFGFLPDDAVIEVSSTVDSGGAVAIPRKPVEPRFAGLIAAVTAYEQAALRAATQRA